MNAKKAKVLRKASGYKNSTKTPAPIKFPGVSKMLQFPIVERRQATRTQYVRRNGEWVKESITQMVVAATNYFVRIGQWWRHDVTPEMKVTTDGEVSQQFQLIPTTKPGKHKPDTERGKYRALKRLESRIGLINVALALEEAGNA